MDTLTQMGKGNPSRRQGRNARTKQETKERGNEETRPEDKQKTEKANDQHEIQIAKELNQQIKEGVWE